MNTLFGKKSRGKGKKNVYLRQNLQNQMQTAGQCAILIYKYRHRLNKGETTMEQLLKILEDNARMSVEDIAAMLNKSSAEVAAMIDLARAQGIIKGYKTLVDWEKAGVNRVEAVIELNVSPKKSRGFDEIAATIASFDEVESVLLMSGGYDLQLVIKGQTFQEIALFVAKRLSPLDDVLSTATHFVLRTYKKRAVCIRTKKSMKESAPCCDGLR